MRLTGLVLSATLLAASTGAYADTIYTYTGQELTTTYAGITLKAGEITGTLTLANPLAPNTTYSSINPTDFSFYFPYYNIVFSLARINYFRGPYSFKNITTDSSGNISLYDIFASTTRNDITLENEGPGFPDYDSVNIYPLPFSFASSGPGSFSTTPSAATPEPSSFALFGTGLLGITGLLSKRWKARTHHRRSPRS